jgi:hypothetical protein
MKKIFVMGLLLSVVALAACSATPGASGTSASGKNSKADYGTLGAGPAPVNLNSLTNYTILAETGITAGAGDIITGNIGNDATYAQMTGFTLTPATPVSSTVSATSILVSGLVFASDYPSGGTPVMLTTGAADLLSAYNDAVGRVNPDFLNTNNGTATDIGGMTLTPGLYKWTTGVTFSSSIILNGGPNDVWIFQIGGVLSTATAGVQVILAGGAQAKNVFWAPISCTLNGASTQLQGIVLSATTVTMVANCSIIGNLYAQTAVTMGANDIIK